MMCYDNPVNESVFMKFVKGLIVFYGINDDDVLWQSSKWIQRKKPMIWKKIIMPSLHEIGHFHLHPCNGDYGLLTYLDNTFE
jgi:hypothetical protein